MSLDHLALLSDDLDRFASAVESGPPEAPIAGCPGWTLIELGEHLGEVHRWVLGALALGAPPAGHDDPAPSDSVALAEWLRAGSARLLDALLSLDPNVPTWHPFPVAPKVAGLWRRRQAQEASVHRWDAERAAGLHPTIDPTFATDGVDEYFTVMLPRLLLREGRRTPSSRLAVVATDTATRWVVDGSTGLPALLPSGVEAEAEIRGDAAAVLLRLWGRPTDAGVELDGPRAVADAWLALGGA
jgi:uncharacterized protein (TIGR03083 family)